MYYLHRNLDFCFNISQIHCHSVTQFSCASTLYKSYLSSKEFVYECKVSCLCFVLKMLLK